MSGTSPGQPPSPSDAPRPGAPTLCVGEPLVDLVCERPLGDAPAGDAFVPHLGGAVANVSVIAARLGAHVALAGGAADDDWGRWLRDRLRREGIDLSLFELAPEAQTPIELVTVGPDGGPRYELYGDSVVTALAALDARMDEAVQNSAALFFGSGTLVGAEQREITMRARELALSLGRPVVFDPTVRRHRWRSRAEAAAVANACVPDALLVRAGAGDAELMTGEEDPERASLALLKAGARMVVITLGVEGAILRGELRLDVEGDDDGAPRGVLSAIGAGEVLTGILLARLAASAYYPAAVAASLPEAVAQATRACERWGALE